MSLQKVIDATDAKRNGNGWKAKCLAHDDNKPSLSINEGDDGRVLVKCHAGCRTEDVVTAAGLTMADLMPESSHSETESDPRREARPSYTEDKIPRRIVATHDYTDEQGKLLFQSVRYEPKDFRQRRPDGRGGWVWSLKGVERVLYALPRLAEAAVDSFVFMPEGEKDADRINAEGGIATTTSGGAKNSHHTDLSRLDGLNVVLLADNDKPGIERCEAIAARLKGKAASVRVVAFPDLPEGGDVSDWLDQGRDLEDLVRLAEQTPEWGPGSLETVSSEDQPDDPPRPQPRALQMRIGNTIDDGATQYAWNRRLVMSAMNVIFSRPGRGKSTLGAAMAGHFTTGRDWPDGSKCERGFVLYLKGEGTDRSVNDRFRLAGADPSMYGIVSRATGAGQEMIDLATDTRHVADLIRQHDAKYVFIDTLDSMYCSMRMIDNADIRRCLHPMQSLAEKLGVCVIVFAHTNKGGYADPIDRLSGGRAIGGAARSVWYLGKRDKDEPECFLAEVKCNDFLPAAAIEYKIVGLSPDQPGAIRWGDVNEDVSAWDLDQPRKAGDGPKADQCQTFLAELLSNGPFPTAEANSKAGSLGFGRRVMTTAKSELGIKSRPAKGVSPPEYYLCLPDQDPPVLTPEKTHACTQPYHPLSG